MREIIPLLLLSLGIAFGQRVLFGDDLNDFPASWTLGGTSGEYWTKKAGRWYSHSFSVKCTPFSQYNNNVAVWMSRAVNFTGYDMGTVSFWVWQETEDGDFLEFQYSTDNGNTWITAWERAGSYPNWRFITISEIPNNANLIRFLFFSDETSQGEGVYIDDVIGYGIMRTLTVLFYDGMDEFPSNWTLWGNYNWARVNNRSRSEPYSAKCAPINGYGYYNRQNNGIDRFFNLASYDYGILRFSFYRHLESGRDSIYVFYRSQDTWRLLMARTGRYTQWIGYSYLLPKEADGVRFQFRSNDTITFDGLYLDDLILYGVSTPRIDLWAVSFLSPPGEVDSGLTVSVQGEIGNNSPAIVGTPVYYRIGNFYNALAIADPIYPYSTTVVNFPDWSVNCPRGTYIRKCTTAYFNDFTPRNDCQIGLITVTYPQGLEEEKERTQFRKNRGRGLTSFSPKGKASLLISNVSGQTVYLSQEEEDFFELKGLSPGVYFLIFKGRDWQEKRKLVLLK